MKKIIVILVALIVLVTGGCSLLQRQQFPSALSIKSPSANLALSGGSLKSVGSQTPIAVGDADAFAIMQNITKDNRTERTITWQSKLPRTSSFLEYREQGHGDVVKIKA